MDAEVVKIKSSGNFSNSLTKTEIMARAAKLETEPPEDDDDDDGSDSMSEASGPSAPSGAGGQDGSAQTGGAGVPQADGLVAQSPAAANDGAVGAAIAQTPSPFAKGISRSECTPSVCNWTGGKGSRHAASQADDDGEDDGPPATNAKEHIAKLRITSILNHKKRGTHIRYAREYAKQNPDAADVDLLLEKIDLAFRCTAFHRGGVDDVSSADFVKTCELLRDSGEEIPSQAKLYILDRFVKDWQADPNKHMKMDVIMDTMFPWDRASAQALDGECQKDIDAVFNA
eukprot:9489908-Pyramimonas_sp.AAC.1